MLECGRHRRGFVQIQSCCYIVTWTTVCELKHARVGGIVVLWNGTFNIKALRTLVRVGMELELTPG